MIVRRVRHRKAVDGTNGKNKVSAAPIVLEVGCCRRQFADFLDRVASRSPDPEEWSSFIVTHYPDEFLEEMRRCTVRLVCGYLPQRADSHEGRQILRAWAIAIRSSVRDDSDQVLTS